MQKTIIHISFLFLLIMCKSSFAQGCPTDINVDSNLHINIQNGKLMYDETKSTSEISSIQTGYREKNSYEHVYGKAIAKFFLNSANEFAISSNGRTWCVYLSKITINTGYQDPIILITKDAPKDSCIYHYIKQHELAHHKVNDDMLNKYLPIIKAEYEKIASANSLSKFSSEFYANKARNKIMNKFQVSTTRITKSFEKEMDKRQSVIDDKYGVEAMIKKCSKVDGKNKTAQIMKLIDSK